MFNGIPLCEYKCVLWCVCKYVCGHTYIYIHTVPGILCIFVVWYINHNYVGMCSSAVASYPGLPVFFNVVRAMRLVYRV